MHKLLEMPAVAPKQVSCASEHYNQAPIYYNLYFHKKCQ